MADNTWESAGEKIRGLFGRGMSQTERLDVVDVFAPVGRTGVELLVASSELQPYGEQRDALRSVQELVNSRPDTNEVVAVFITPATLPTSLLVEALERMEAGEIIPLTFEQAQDLASLDANILDTLEPIHELVRVAASRPPADLANAADELLTDIDILIERQLGRSG